MPLVHIARRLATRVCTPAVLERRIEPGLADWQNEYLEAVDHGRYWGSHWIQIAGVFRILKVMSLVVLEQGAHALTHLDAETQAALIKAGAIFGIVLTFTTVLLAWLPFNMMPVPTPSNARLLLYLMPQALPIAVPLSVTTAIVLGLGCGVVGRAAALALMCALFCSVLSFVTLAWWAPASNQAFRTEIVGFEIPKEDNELTIGELGTRIEQIRAFDPVAPARRLSVVYHTRWALSCTPLVLATFALALVRHSKRRAVLALMTLIANGGFVFLLMWTSNLAFRGVVWPLMAAWLPNLTFLGLTMVVLVWSVSRATNEVS